MRTDGLSDRSGPDSCFRQIRPHCTDPIGTGLGALLCKLGTVDKKGF